jgi:hypothetical protein
MSGDATAEGFFEQLFGSFNRPSVSSAPPAQPLSYAPPSDRDMRISAHQPSLGSRINYCVRICDGRYFPIPNIRMATPVEQCNALCPASPTKIYSGSDISSAITSDGSRYRALENAFAYRKQLISTCTCNGKDQFGLAKIDLKDDQTLKVGDLVATTNGQAETAMKPTSSQVRLRDFRVKSDRNDRVIN